MGLFRGCSFLHAPQSPGEDPGGESGQDSSITKPIKRTPTLINRLNTDKIRDKQEQPLNLDKANDGMKFHDPRNRHHERYGNQTHGVEEAQRSAYENQTPARKAMNQAEERIRQTRQALDAGGSLPPKQKQQH